MKLTDGKKTIEIIMTVGDSPDWSMDFFNAGSLECDEESHVFYVQDVDYCVEQAMDWENGKGDFYNPDIKPNPYNYVIVTEL